MIGLILESETLPAGVVKLARVEWRGKDWIKIQGMFNQVLNDDWLKYRGIFPRVVDQPSKMYISSIDLINLLPDETIPEIEDIANNVSGSATKKARGKAYKILKFLGHPKPLNLKSDTFSTNARWLVSNSDIPSFKQTTLNAIYTELGLL